MSASQCPHCGHEAGAEARFCPRCGIGLDAPSPTGEPGGGTGLPLSERRQLTVAFCDLAGSTELSAGLDPEDYSDLVGSYHARAGEIVRSFGGEVEKLLGDGILIRFGWPEAQDDDPEYAVRAALEIVEQITRPRHDGRELAVRVGVHSGPAVIEVGGTPNRPEVSTLGETLNLAARLQGVAVPNTVVASQATLDLLEERFATEDLGPKQLQGFAEPVRVHRVLGPATRRSAIDHHRRTVTAFVDRRAEIALLEAQWKRAQQGASSALLITGEPGVGKSRLVHELRRLVHGAAPAWLQAGCSSYTRTSAFRPAIDLAEANLALLADIASDRSDALARQLAAVGVAAPDAPTIIAALLEPHAGDSDPALIAMSPERRRERTIEVLLEWLVSHAATQPTILFIEDLQWSDPSTLEVLGRLVARAPAVPLLVLLTARTEFKPPWDDAVESLRLQRLPEADVRELVGSLAGDRAMPGAVVERIVDGTGGIPLYAEEVGRMVLESGLLVQRPGRFELSGHLGELDIPVGLQSSLLARLDRLGPGKQVAQVASVAGREFPYELVSRVSGLDEGTLQAGLSRLVEADLLLEQGVLPDASYAFKHALVQDAAYRSLLRRTRRELHERIARALVDVAPPISPEVVARHFEAAGNTERALHHYQRAADEAARHSGHAEAASHLRRAIELLGQLAGSPEGDLLEAELQIALASSIINARSYGDPAIEAAYERARDLCESVGDDGRLALTLVGLSIFYSNRGEIQLGADLAQRVLDVARREGDDTLELLAHVQLAFPRMYQGRFGEGLAHARRASALYDRERHRELAFRFGTDHGVAARCFAGWASMGTGDLDHALTYALDGIALARELGHPFSLAYALFFEATVHWALGDADGQRAASERALSVAEEQGFDFWIGLARIFRANERANRTGEARWIEEMFAAGLVVGETGNLGGLPTVLACVAEAQRAVGDIEGALVTVDRALGVSAQTGQVWWDSEHYRLRGELKLTGAAGQGAERAQAIGDLQRALQVAGEQRFVLMELKAATSLARIWAGEGQPERARDVLSAPLRRLEVFAAARPVQEARSLLGELGGLADASDPTSESEGASLS